MGWTGTACSGIPNYVPNVAGSWPLRVSRTASTRRSRSHIRRYSTHLDRHLTVVSTGVEGRRAPEHKMFVRLPDKRPNPASVNWVEEITWISAEQRLSL